MNAPPPSERRRGLGRGLGSLIPTAPAEPAEAAAAPAAMPATSAAPAAVDGAGSTTASSAASAPATGEASGLQEVAGAHFAELPLESITANARQPRTSFDEEQMAELVHSIKEVGLLQPVVVRPTGSGTYELIMGERRWRASKEAGKATIPAIVRETDDDAMLRDALLENLHRSELNPLEEAAAYQQLLDDFACTQTELAERIGRSRPQISNTLRLLQLSPAAQRRVAAGVLSAGHARALLGVTDAGVQDRLADRVVAEGISVRGLEELVATGGHLDSDDDAPRQRTRKPSAPGLRDLEERLGDRLDTRVKIAMGKAKGKITVEFASLGDLERIVGIVDPRNRTDRPI